MNRSARIGAAVAGAAAALSMGLVASVGAGAATPVHSAPAAAVLPAPQGSYQLHVVYNGVTASLAMTVTPGACSATGCTGTWTPTVVGMVGTYTWSATDGRVVFVLGQDHFYGKVTSTGINSAAQLGRLVVKCPKVGTTTGTWYASF